MSEHQPDTIGNDNKFHSHKQKDLTACLLT